MTVSLMAHREGTQVLIGSETRTACFMEYLTKTTGLNLQRIFYRQVNQSVLFNQAFQAVVMD